MPLAVRNHDFSSVIHAIRLAGFSGVNVTVPHKQAAYAIAHSSDQPATKAQAANLLCFREDGRIEARNCDVSGLAAALEQSLGQGQLDGRVVVLLGAGGAARAAILALDQLGVRETRVLNRNRTRAATVVASLGPEVGSVLGAFGFDDWERCALEAALLVNATSAGMNDREPLSLSLAALAPSAAVCDLVYSPLETQLLAEARAKGHRTIDGLEMLIYQAMDAFEAFYGLRPAASPALRRHLTENAGG